MFLSNRFRLVILVVGSGVLLLSGCDTFTQETQVRDLETRNAQLQETIQVMGTPAATLAALEQAATQNALLQVQLNNVQGTSIAMQGTLTVYQLNGGQPPASNNPAAGQAPVITPEAALGGSQTTFSQTTMATQRDAYDCAANSATTFDDAEDIIYAITTITNLKAGSTISARWKANGALYEESVCWTPDQDWPQVCAYCELTPVGATFDAGSWTVELLLDGQILSQAQFQVVGSANATPTP
jgi:outer membrane murein-binding lipoprotein Lpp